MPDLDCELVLSMGTLPELNWTLQPLGYQSLGLMLDGMNGEEVVQ